MIGDNGNVIDKASLEVLGSIDVSAVMLSWQDMIGVRRYSCHTKSPMKSRRHFRLSALSCSNQASLAGVQRRTLIAILVLLS